MLSRARARATARSHWRTAAPASLIAASTLLMTGCAATSSTEPATPHAEPHWSYERADGPAHWADLSDDWAGCDTGAAQSPIDLPNPATLENVPDLGGATLTDDRTFTLAASAVSGTIADNGHALQFTAADDVVTSSYEDEDYRLLQFHAHSAAEHSVDGVRAPVEFHFVHEDDDGELLVVGAFGIVGAENPALSPLVAAATSGVDVPATVTLGSLLPMQSGYSAYTGSLTTPPCSEEVQWIVLDTPLPLSETQLDALTAVHDDNFRPTQPLGDRQIDRGVAVVTE